MRTLLHPFLPNGAWGDPALWVDLPDEGCATLIDLGDLRRVSNRKLLRIDRVVVTHAHMDHFVGFDQLLRVCLGREAELRITGPRGFLGHVRGKVASYVWNLIESYPIRIVAEEIDGDRIRAEAFSGRGRMQPEPLPDRGFLGPIHAHRAYTMHVGVLDHGIPVLGAALRETEHLSVDKDRLTRQGLTPGPWLAELKQHVRRCTPGNPQVAASAVDGSTRSLPVSTLSAELLSRTKGQHLAYLTDLRYTEANRRVARELAGNADLLVCEAAFLHEDAELAAERCHLTARQAGELAREVGARKLAPFHHSTRYQGREEELVDEAAAAFGGAVVQLPPGPAPLHEAPLD